MLSSTTNCSSTHLLLPLPVPHCSPLFLTVPPSSSSSSSCSSCQVHEPDYNSLGGRLTYLPPRFMTVNTAVEQLLEAEQDKKEVHHAHILWLFLSANSFPFCIARRVALTYPPVEPSIARTMMLMTLVPLSSPSLPPSHPAPSLPGLLLEIYPGCGYGSTGTAHTEGTTLIMRHAFVHLS